MKKMHPHYRVQTLIDVFADTVGHIHTLRDSCIDVVSPDGQGAPNGGVILWHLLLESLFLARIVLSKASIAVALTTVVLTSSVDGYCASSARVMAGFPLALIMTRRRYYSRFY